MGYRHSEEEIVDAAAAVALEHGMSGLTYRRVADRLEISDRMVVYYLPTKADLVFAAMTAVSVKLQQLARRGVWRRASGSGCARPQGVAGAHHTGG